VRVWAPIVLFYQLFLARGFSSAPLLSTPTPAVLIVHTETRVPAAVSSINNLALLPGPITPPCTHMKAVFLTRPRTLLLFSRQGQCSGACICSLLRSSICLLFVQYLPLPRFSYSRSLSLSLSRSSTFPFSHSTLTTIPSSSSLSLFSCTSRKLSPTPLPLPFSPSFTTHHHVCCSQARGWPEGLLHPCSLLLLLPPLLLLLVRLCWRPHARQDWFLRGHDSHRRLPSPHHGDLERASGHRAREAAGERAQEPRRSGPPAAADGAGRHAARSQGSRLSEGREERNGEREKRWRSAGAGERRRKAFGCNRLWRNSNKVCFIAVGSLVSLLYVSFFLVGLCVFPSLSLSSRPPLGRQLPSHSLVSIPPSHTLNIS